MYIERKYGFVRVPTDIKLTYTFNFVSDYIQIKHNVYGDTNYK